MVKFGFALNPSSRIDLDKTDREKFAQLVELEPDVLKCMACGSCTASCTAGKFTPTSVRSAILEIQNGRWQQALDMLKGCLLCGKCTMVCPRAINTRHLILAINEVYQSGK
ncbi:MAG: 4Fe-4S dicluster domain-containing protein [Bacteroidales bacterium]|nr:4Fe-4S dicluster domain-containing protein [Bacteroidales bacterium]